MPRTCSEWMITRNKNGEIVSRKCDRQALEGSDRCVFHDPYAWRTQAELMRQEIREKIKEGDLNFQKYHLPEIDFLMIAGEFRGPTDFSEAVFHGKADFSHVTFFSSVDFSGAIFLEDALFNEAKFLGDTWFYDAKFSEEAAFTFAEFSKAARFGAAEFSRYAWFSYAKFLGVTNFNGAKFSKDAWFIYADFPRRASFVHVEFLAVTHFNNTKFSEERKALFDFSRFHEIVEFEGIPLNYVRLTFKNTVFDRGLSIYEYLWGESGFRLKIEESDLVLAADSYQALRRGFENMGHYRVAGELFYREMTCRKNMISLRRTAAHVDSMRIPEQLRSFIQTAVRIQPLRPILERIALLLKVRIRWRKLRDWLWMQTFSITCGFGERPWNVIRVSAATLFIFALIYFSLITTSMTFPESILTAIYLSFDSFVALGTTQENIFPISWRWIKYLEAVLGLFMMSLFLVVFTRKMSRG